MSDYFLEGRHSPTLDRRVRGKKSTVRVVCELTLHRIELVNDTEDVLTGKRGFSDFTDMSIDPDKIYRGRDMSGAFAWNFQLVLITRAKYARTKGFLGRRLSNDDLQYAPELALRQMDQALRAVWSQRIGAAALTDQRPRSLTMLM